MRKTMLISLLPVLFFCGCQSFPAIQEPKVSLNSVNIAGVTLSGVNLIANVDVENHNAFSIPMPKVDWELFVNDSSFTSGTVEKEGSIASNGKISLDIPMSVGYDRLYGTLGSLAGLLGSGSRELPYKVAMGISFPLPLLENIVYKLDHSGSLPSPF